MPDAGVVPQADAAGPAGDGPGPAGAPFQVVFHMTEMGLLKVHGREADSGRFGRGG